MSNPNELKPLCTGKALAGLVAAAMGSPLDLQSTPGCPCPTCAGINATRQLAANVGPIKQTGFRGILDAVAAYKPTVTVNQGKDGIWE